MAGIIIKGYTSMRTMSYMLASILPALRQADYRLYYPTTFETLFHLSLHCLHTCSALTLLDSLSSPVVVHPT